MQVDFYQLGGAPPEQVIASLADKLWRGQRLLVVAEDELSRPARPDVVGPGAHKLPSARAGRRHR